jgi:hypothetical protein
MERIPNLKSKDEMAINTQIQRLTEKVPNENAMKFLEADLQNALNAAKGKNNRIMEQAFQSAYGHHNALAAKHYDVLEELEEVIDKIKTLAKPR